MRLIYPIVFIILTILLAVCGIHALRSKKAFARAVSLLEFALILPITGNLFIVGSSDRIFSLIGYYTYFLGMDIALLALVNFTNIYCRGIGDGRQQPTIVYLGLIGNFIQIGFNLVFHHAFSIDRIMVQGIPYYRLVPHFGQIVHRIVDYTAFICVIIIFVLGCVRTSRIFRERFAVILVTILIIGIIQTYYTFTGTPIDRSLIGYGIVGLLIFYFALYYRPLRFLDSLLSNITSEMSESIFVFALNGSCIWANTKGCELVNIQNNFDDAAPRLTEMFGDLEKLSSESYIQRMIYKDGKERYYTLERNSVNDNRNQPAGIYLRIRDITEEQRRLKQEIYEATHDRLTDLYTREYLYTKIQEVIEQNPSEQYYVIFVDIKNFKIVNDIFGTAFGDRAVCSVAQWVRRGRSERSRFGRLAGDTFGLFLPKEEFDPVKVEQELAEFTVITEKVNYHLLIHLGIYIIEQNDRANISIMFDRAHLSLATIQDEYHTHIAFYNDKIREQLLWNQGLSAQLQNAIKCQQIQPFLQPIADKNGRIVGAEALARWIHPEYGFLSPDKFIPIFEKNGMIVELDRYIWRCACEILARWQHEERELFLSVNISPKDFYFLDVVKEIRHLVEKYQIDPKQLRIEITETVMMNDAENRLAILEEFHRSGFIIEIDDFGSGYSSLNMLKNMPVDVLKIDMNFLGRTNDTERAQTIVQGIINLSQALGIVSLTEGVETQAQVMSLAKMGCKLFQGYYFSKPLPLWEFEQKLQEENKA